MKYATVCSGIEAPSLAWHPLGWQPVFFSEIEKFPSAVLNHYYPNTPNLGDMTKIQAENYYGSVDVFCGGTPCQSFSIAGLRKGLADPRGNLMLSFVGIAAKMRPRWIIWENVPGVLSSNAGRDFGTLLGALGELGYGFAYRVLDAQFFGVAQRRRRVFVIGYLGDWRPAAAVLFEPESLRGHTSESRKKRKAITFYAESSIGGYRETNVGGTLKKSGGCLGGGSETFTVCAFKVRSGCEGGGKGYLGQDELTFTLSTNQDQMIFEKNIFVRRLTPIECERLQGFPDNFTNIPWRGKSESSDSLRYAALGNSMAVPVMAWLGKRIDYIQNLML